jgi:hypothetical protein
MSVKRILDFESLIVDGAMVGSITSPATNILYMDRVGYQLSWAGTPTGDFTIEVSNDEVVWVELTLSVPVAAAGSADDAFIDVETAAKFVRVKYTVGSGTGTLQAHITAKSISG